MFLCQRYTDEKLKDIGGFFGVGESGVSQACRRVKDKIKKPMPRQPRLDAPGVLQHVMAHGIERRKIFWDDKDCSLFLE